MVQENENENGRDSNSNSNSNSDSSNEGNHLNIIEEEEEVAAPNEDVEEDGINQDQLNEDVLEESDTDSDFDERILGSDTESVSKEETVHTRMLQMQSKRPTHSGNRKLKYNYNEESSNDDDEEEEEEAIDTTKQSASSTCSGRNNDGGNVSKDGSDSDDYSINEAIN